MCVDTRHTKVGWSPNSEMNFSRGDTMFESRISSPSPQTQLWPAHFQRAQATGPADCELLRQQERLLFQQQQQQQQQRRLLLSATAPTPSQPAEEPPIYGYPASFDPTGLEGYGDNPFHSSMPIPPADNDYPSPTWCLPAPHDGCNQAIDVCQSPQRGWGCHIPPAQRSRASLNGYTFAMPAGVALSAPGPNLDQPVCWPGATVTYDHLAADASTYAPPSAWPASMANASMPMPDMADTLVDNQGAGTAASGPGWMHFGHGDMAQEARHETVAMDGGADSDFWEEVAIDTGQATSHPAPTQWAPMSQQGPPSLSKVVGGVRANKSRAQRMRQSVVGRRSRVEDERWEEAGLAASAASHTKGIPDNLVLVLSRISGLAPHTVMRGLARSVSEGQTSSTTTGQASSQKKQESTSSGVNGQMNSSQRRTSDGQNNSSSDPDRPGQLTHSERQSGGGGGDSGSSGSGSGSGDGQQPHQQQSSGYDGDGSGDTSGNEPSTKGSTGSDQAAQVQRLAAADTNELDASDVSGSSAEAEIESQQFDSEASAPSEAGEERTVIVGPTDHAMLPSIFSEMTLPVFAAPSSDSGRALPSGRASPSDEGVASKAPILSRPNKIALSDVQLLSAARPGLAPLSFGSSVHLAIGEGAGCRPCMFERWPGRCNKSWLCDFCHMHASTRRTNGRRPQHPGAPASTSTSRPKPKTGAAASSSNTNINSGSSNFSNSNNAANHHGHSHSHSHEPRSISSHRPETTAVKGWQYSDSGCWRKEEVAAPAGPASEPSSRTCRGSHSQGRRVDGSSSRWPVQ